MLLSRTDQVLQQFLHLDHIDGQLGCLLDAFGFAAQLKKGPFALGDGELVLDCLIPFLAGLGHFGQGQHPVQHRLANQLEQCHLQRLLGLVLLHVFLPRCRMIHQCRENSLLVHLKEEEELVRRGLSLELGIRVVG